MMRPLDIIETRGLIAAMCRHHQCDVDGLPNFDAAIIRDYCSDGPGYAGDVIMCVYGGDPCFHDTWTWDNDTYRYVLSSSADDTHSWAVKCDDDECHCHDPQFNPTLADVMAMLP